MRWIIVSFIILLLSVPLILAAVDFQCNTNEECELKTGKESICVDSVCVISEITEEESALEPFQKKAVGTEFALLTFKLKQDTSFECDSRGCLNLAPQRPNPVLDFLRWLVYA